MQGGDVTNKGKYAGRDVSSFSHSLQYSHATSATNRQVRFLFTTFLTKKHWSVLQRWIQVARVNIV